MGVEPDPQVTPHLSIARPAKVWGLGYGVWGLRFGVGGFRLRVSGMGSGSGVGGLHVYHPLEFVQHFL